MGANPRIKEKPTHLKEPTWGIKIATLTTEPTTLRLVRVSGNCVVANPQTKKKQTHGLKENICGNQPAQLTTTPIDLRTVRTSGNIVGATP